MVKRFFKGKFIYGEVIGTDKNGKEILQKACEKCGGSGTLQHFHYNDNGICYSCKGTGKGKIVKGTTEMTEEEIKEEILKIIVEKKKKRNEFCDDELVTKWRKESIEYLCKAFRIG